MKISQLELLMTSISHLLYKPLIQLVGQSFIYSLFGKISIVLAITTRNCVTIVLPKNRQDSIYNSYILIFDRSSETTESLHENEGFFCFWLSGFIKTSVSISFSPDRDYNRLCFRFTNPVSSYFSIEIGNLARCKNPYF